MPWPGPSLAPGPGLCELCRMRAPERVCAACQARFAPARPRCAGCGVALPDGATWCGDCVREPLPTRRCVAALDYRFPWNTLLTRLKFGDEPELASLLATQLANAGAAAGMPRPDLVLPVPLSDERLAERGYDQAWELARRLARTLGVPAAARVLTRRFDRPAQTALARAARLHNLRGAFAVAPEQAAQVEGRAVALVDDVMTTGATARAAATALLDAQARSVDLWIVARTPLPADT